MRRRPVLPAMFAVVLLVVGQLVAFAHEAAERHVTCAEHGEQLEAVDLAEALHACEDDHFVAVGESGEHADCAIARALRQSSNAPTLWFMPQLALVEIELGSPPAHVRHSFAVSLYLIAPKTSPPV